MSSEIILIGTNENKALFAIYRLTNRRFLVCKKNNQFKLSPQPKLYQSTIQNIKNNLNKLFKTTVHITTRGRRKLDTNSIPITRRHRAPNKTKMELPNGNPTNNTNTIATQTDCINNIGQGRNPLITKQQFNFLADIKYDESPNYLKNLYKVFGEDFIAEATKADPQSQRLYQIIGDKDWTTLKYFSRYWRSLKRHLGTTQSGCILYDGKLFIPSELRKLIMNSIHRKHPGQTGMMHLANLTWFPRIHRENVTLTQNCQPCIKIGKNLKSLIPENKISKLPPPQKPNEEVQLDFEGPITDENQKGSYILASVDRYSRYPHAKVHHNCEAETTIQYLNQYIKFHGIPRNLRCNKTQTLNPDNSKYFLNTIMLN